MRLQRRAGRSAAGRFLVEGPQAVRESLARRVRGGAGPGALEELYATSEAASRHREILADAGRAGVRLTEVSDAVMAALAETVTPQGLVGVAPLLADGPEALAGARLVVVLVEPRDPGNVGTVLRAADAAGADALVLVGDAVDPHNGKCVRASAGSLFHLPVLTGVPADEALALLRSAGLRVLALTGTAEQDLFALADAGDLSAGVALLLGNEAHGLPQDLIAGADLAARVPLLGGAESLNLAMAATVAAYTVARAHRRPPG